MVLVCIVITHLSSSNGSQHKNSISLFFLLIFVLKYLLWTEIEAFGLFLAIHQWW